MTRRIDKPDTPADKRLREVLTGAAPRSFVMVAGAGSGKTTSLVKALDFIRTREGESLRHKKQRIACITYTEVAKDEIWGDVGHDTLFHVSTIHSFLWNVVKPFQRDIAAWVEQRIELKISELADAAAKFTKRTQQRTREKNAEEISRYCEQRDVIRRVPSFRYLTGSDYPNGILGHSDILTMGPEFLGNKSLLQRLFANRYPYVFVDESQDTEPAVIDALMAVSRAHPNSFTLGFFGDPMQKIYMVGLGEIPLGEGWARIEKPENFRCPTSVLTLINNIRKDGDALLQTRGRHVCESGVEKPFKGKARLIIMPADERRAARLKALRCELAKEDSDDGWLHNNTETTGTKVLVIAHRMAALHLDFSNLYDAFNTRASENLKEGFRDGSHWSVRPILTSVLPAIEARHRGDEAEVMRLLRSSSPRLAPNYVQTHAIAEILSGLDTNLRQLQKLLEPGSGASVRELISLIHTHGLFALDERMIALLGKAGETEEPSEGEGDSANLLTFFRCPAEELHGYRSYIDNESPFDTQQGIKGAEFPKVIVVLDDAEGRHNQFSYDKFLGLKALSDTDRKRIDAGEESTLDRTRRLFYVCCSRATESLAVVLYAQDPASAYVELSKAGVFDPEHIRIA